ncbi:response regulator [Pseudoalteromonas sp.]|uniref:response regulator n=1 Tax=Pseudoalteromonas sp. TaxID=53249 RepID=UPI003567068E
MNNLTVLLVENDLSLAMLLEMWLSKHVNQVEITTTYDEAQEAMQKQKFDFLLIDTSQSKETQFDDFNAFYSRQSKSTPTIIFTSCNDSDDLLKFKAMEYVLAVFEKPLTLEQLNAAQELVHG